MCQLVHFLNDVQMHFTFNVKPTYWSVIILLKNINVIRKIKFNTKERDQCNDYLQCHYDKEVQVKEENKYSV